MGRSGRRLSVHVIAEELNMNRESMCSDSNKAFAHLKDGVLNDEQKQHRIPVSSDLLYNAEIFDRVITYNKTFRLQNYFRISSIASNK